MFNPFQTLHVQQKSNNFVAILQTNQVNKPNNMIVKQHFQSYINSSPD